jgi:uncharacterized protein
MKNILFILSFFGILIMQSFFVTTQAADKQVEFVVQLTRSGDNYGHRRAFLQLDKILSEIGEDKIKFTVVAYEEGIQALTANNKKTSQLLTKLANRGVTFKACRISMNAWNLTENDFPLEVEYVPAGAPEVIRLQMKGYKYWKQ